MDIDLLRTFLEVNKTRHFGRASENLYLTPAAVSARIRQLEGLLSVPLFIRNRNNIQLTVEGERLVPHAETMLMAWSRARQDVGLVSEQSKQIYMGATFGLWNDALQQKLATVHGEIPGITLRAEAHPHDVLVKMLLEQTLDIALLYDPPSVADFEALKIGQLKVVLATSGEDSNGRAAFKENYVYVDWGTSFSLFHAGKFGEVSPPVLHTNMSSIAQTFLLSTSASAFIPVSVVEKSGGLLKEAKNVAHYTRGIFAMYRAANHKEEDIKQVVSLLHGLRV